MRGSWVWMYAAMTVCGCAIAAPTGAPPAQPAENIPGPATLMPGELPELLLMRGQVAVEVARVAGGEEVYLSLNDTAVGPMQILVQLEGEWPGAARSWAIADGTVKAWKGEGVTILDKASGETLLLWLTEACRDAAAPGAGVVTPIQAYGWSAFWDWQTALPPGVPPEIDKCEPGFPCLAGGDPEADSCSIGGCSEPPTSCSVGGCVGQYRACCGCAPHACCRCVRACGD